MEQRFSYLLLLEKQADSRETWRNRREDESILSFKDALEADFKQVAGCKTPKIQKLDLLLRNSVFNIHFNLLEFIFGCLNVCLFFVILN